MMILIPLGGRVLLQKAPDSWVLIEYRIPRLPNSTAWDIRAVAGTACAFATLVTEDGSLGLSGM